MCVNAKSCLGFGLNEDAKLSKWEILRGGWIYGSGGQEGDLSCNYS